MREIGFDEISSAVSGALEKCCVELGERETRNLESALAAETHPLGREILRQLCENAACARESGLPLCQDTGIVTVFADVGRDVRLLCGLGDAVNAGVRDAYGRFYFRKSVADPLSRKNTGDNTPAVIHTTIAEGDRIRLRIAPKGAGSENMSAQAMLNPSDGTEGIVKFVLDTVVSAGGRPCPPLYLGVGIGGNFEQCCLMAKEALFRDGRSADPAVAALEERLEKEINATGVGPMGLGGKTTCFGVFVNTAPCHIASLPVAVNVQCHAARHAEVVI